jgi:hypothetical protein
MVLDQGNGRLSVYSPQFRYVRSFPMPRAYTGIWLAPSGFVVNAPIETQQRAGEPFHVLGPQGEVLRSFGRGARDEVVNPSEQLDRRLLAPAKSGEMWSAAADGSYRIQRWSSDGKLLADFDRAPAWFPKREGPRAPFSMDTPPEPVMTGLAAVGDTAVWVVAMVADPEWRRGLTPRRVVSVEQRPGFVVSDPGAVYDTRAHLLDARSGAVIAETRIADAVAFALGNGLFGAVRVRDDGTSVVYVIRLVLER